MWHEIWNKIKIKNVTPFKKNHISKKPDNVRVTLEMPIEVYSLFRAQIEAPDSLRGRRATDTKPEPVKEKPPVYEFAWVQKLSDEDLLGRWDILDGKINDDFAEELYRELTKRGLSIRI